MRSRWFAPIIASLLAVGLAHAQSSRPDGPLVVWVVTPGLPAPMRALVAPPLSGTMPDQTAGSYGQTNGSFGQTAGSYGQTAGSYGQTVGSFGQTAGSYGQTSSSYGQTLAGFGTSLDNLPAAAARANGTLRAATKSGRSRLVEDFVRESGRFGQTQVTFEDVPANDLEARLAQSRHAGPDLLIGAPLPALWSSWDTGLVRRYGLVTLTPTSREEQSEEAAAQPKKRPEFSILLAAPHPETARAFVLWALGASGCGGACGTPPGEVAGAVAAGSAALRDVLTGTRPGGVDVEYAEADPEITQATALGLYDRELFGDLSVQVHVLSAHANERFAILGLNAVVESHAVFGAVQALVVLRRDAKGAWRTLQVSPSLRGDQLGRATFALANYAKHVNVEQIVLPLGIAQAAPVDGDVRPLRPELWWDNFGGATLQVVESQARVGPGKNAWLGSNLYFVPDTNQHLRTQVSARFASGLGQYRWRVWSLGVGGTLTISPWRTLRIVP